MRGKEDRLRNRRNYVKEDKLMNGRNEDKQERKAREQKN
jgi:hypothetical protein